MLAAKGEGNIMSEYQPENTPEGDQSYGNVPPDGQSWQAVPAEYPIVPEVSSPYQAYRPTDSGAVVPEQPVTNRPEESWQPSSPLPNWQVPEVNQPVFPVSQAAPVDPVVAVNTPSSMPSSSSQPTVHSGSAGAPTYVAGSGAYQTDQSNQMPVTNLEPTYPAVTDYQPMNSQPDNLQAGQFSTYQTQGWVPEYTYSPGAGQFTQPIEPAVGPAGPTTNPVDPSLQMYHGQFQADPSPAVNNGSLAVAPDQAAAFGSQPAWQPQSQQQARSVVSGEPRVATSTPSQTTQDSTVRSSQPLQYMPSLEGNQYAAYPQLSPEQMGTQPTSGSASGPVVQTRKAHSKLVAGMLGIFLGAFGVQNFYLGNTGRGMAQLMITCIGAFFFFIGPVVSWAWGILEGILILCSRPGSSHHKDAYGLELTE